MSPHTAVWLLAGLRGEWRRRLVVPSHPSHLMVLPERCLCWDLPGGSGIAGPREMDKGKHRRMAAAVQGRLETQF